MAKRTAKSTFIQRSRAVGAAEKAAYHEITGAGRSHVKRKFFGLSSADETLITERVANQLERRLQEST